MSRNTLLSCASLLLIAVSACLAAAENADESALTKVGDAVPAFELKLMDGTAVTPTSLRGKVTVINFFATWCGPCRAEMPHLEKAVWQKFKDNGKFTMVAVGREHSNEELAAFQKEEKLTFPFAADPQRQTYSKFAKQFIPRTYVIDAEGKIVFQSVGYDPAEFARMVDLIEKELRAVAPKS